MPRLAGRPPASALRFTASLLPFLVFVAVYVPRVGHGFILDDFRWIYESRIRGFGDLIALFSQNNGFYRPVVAVTFAINHLLGDLEPFWYGVTNVALALTAAASIYALARAVRLHRGAAILAASIWLLNFHGINMAVLWISGRTALLLTVAAVAAAWALVRRHLAVAALFMAIALFSKEEAVALPVILGAWMYLLDSDDPAHRRTALVMWTVISLALLAVYLVLRIHSGAMTLATAPAYYRYTLDPLAIARNLIEYADRTLTLSAIVVLLAWLMLRPRRGHDGRVSAATTVIEASILWIVGGYALTLWLPVRSSLYACFPSVGACLIAGAICERWWMSATEGARRRALIATIMLTLIAAPIHYVRTNRLVSQADVSQRAWNELVSLTRDLPDDVTVVIQDDMSRRANIHSAFGSMVDLAYELKTGRRIHFWLAPQLDLPGDPPCQTCVARTLTLRDGVLVRAP